jgi:RecA/RadA recombinase
VPDLEVIEDVDAETGEVTYHAEGTCDCYKRGLFKPRPEPDEQNQQGGLKQIEVEEDDGDGKTKKRKTTAFAERLKRYEENSYEEFRVAFVDVEKTWDSKWGEKLGVDSRRLIYVQPQTAEEAIDVYESLILTGAINLLIMDSIAQMTPSEEVRASTMDWQQGLAARLTNKWNRITVAAMTKVMKEYGHVPTQIWINQERIDIQKKFGSKKTKPGGNAQKFTPSVEVYMWSSGWVKASRDSDLKEDFRGEIGKEVNMNFQVQKNKTAPAQATGSYVMSVIGRQAGQVIDLPYVLAQAEKYGIVRKQDKPVKWFLGDEEFKTKGAMLAKMEDKEVFLGLKDALLKKMLSTLEEM